MLSRYYHPNAGLPRKQVRLQPSMRALLVSCIALTLAGSPALAGATRAPSSKPKSVVTKEVRLGLLRRAQVWTPTDVRSMDLRAGPQGKGAFPPDAEVTCDYLEKKLTGSSPKFDCTIGANDVARVKYGAGNGEVEGTVAASRLLWALGFGYAPAYSVRVTCRGCPVDPWKNRKRVDGSHVFDPAVVMRLPRGREIKTAEDSGWGWQELDLVDHTKGGATRAQLDAFKLLAVLMQHTDNKPAQQELVCLPGRTGHDDGCARPFLILRDVGLTFGHGNFSNSAATGSVNFTAWSKTPVWRDADTCVGHMSRSHTGTLGDPTISEAGRAFLAGLLIQLSDRQLADLFSAAKVDRRSRQPNAAEKPPGATVDEWVAAFKQKREEIVSKRCPS